MNTQPDGATEAEKITQLLHDWRTGNQDARERLIPLIYPQLRLLATKYMSAENSGHTLSATALVHEAYLKILGSGQTWEDRVHFFAVAARMMRHVLVDHAKTKRRAKRGGGAAKISLDDAVVVSSAPESQLIDLNEALDELTRIDKRKAELVELVFFGGMSQAEAAAAIGVSETTVQRELRFAKAWLHNFLGEKPVED